MTSIITLLDNHQPITVEASKNDVISLASKIFGFLSE